MEACMHHPIILHLTFGPHLIAYSNPCAKHYFKSKNIGIPFKTLCREEKLFFYLDKAFKKMEKEPTRETRLIWEGSEKITLWTLQTIHLRSNKHLLKMIAVTGQPLFIQNR